MIFTWHSRRISFLFMADVLSSWFGKTIYIELFFYEIESLSHEHIPSKYELNLDYFPALSRLLLNWFIAIKYSISFPMTTIFFFNLTLGRILLHVCFVVDFILCLNILRIIKVYLLGNCWLKRKKLCWRKLILSFSFYVNFVIFKFLSFTHF